MTNRIKVIRKGDPSYNEARKISNLLLLNQGKLSPDEIYYCQNANDVLQVLNYVQQTGKALRIRSGGHHHEGACSGDNAVVIDTSEINTITVDTVRSTVCIGSGAKLKSVYEALNCCDVLIPGGGCDTVAIGGLLQGGGWGPYSRLYGMTCDALVSATMVIADGSQDFKIVEVTGQNAYKDLFQALKGSGGGNFGVVTSFTLKTQSLENRRKQAFTIKSCAQYTPKQLLYRWFTHASKSDFEITSFGRLYPAKNQTTVPLFYISGMIIVVRSDTELEIKRKIAAVMGSDFPTNCVDLGSQVQKKYSSDKKEEPATDQLRFSSLENSFSTDFFGLAAGLPIAANTSKSAPKITCNAPYPHKVSSFFPKKGINYQKLSEFLFDYMQRHPGFEDKLHCYLSLHGLGGNIREGDNFFYYKDRDFMFQIQAWWLNPEDRDHEKYLAWVENLRWALQKNGFTEGCFVNFPDYNCIRPTTVVRSVWRYDASDNHQRMALLKQFYGEVNLKKLLIAKEKYDMNNTFTHEMSLKSGSHKNDWIGGFEESNPAFQYPNPDLSSLEILDNMANIDKLQRQMKAKWPEFSWTTVMGNEKSRCFQMFATNISRIGYTDKGRVFSIICPQQGAYFKKVGINFNVEVTVTGQRGWVNEKSKQMAADLGVVGKIWFSPDYNSNTLIKFLMKVLDKSKFPFSKATALEVQTSRSGRVEDPYFPLLKGENQRFQSPDFAKHQKEAFTVAHLDVQINGIASTHNEIVDKFNTVVLRIFNLMTGNMLLQNNVLSWNIWFDKPAVVNQKEWREHAEYWRHSLNVNHCSPDGEGTDARYFDGSKFKSNAVEVYGELIKMFYEVIKPYYRELGIKNLKELEEMAVQLEMEAKAVSD